MQIIESSRLVMFDVDDTLVIWDWKELNPDGVGLVSIVDPNNSVSVLVLPHNRHIELMKQFKARGHTIVVWSQGGYEWAKAVVDTLGIAHMVDFVMDKPSWYVDDLHANAWMKAPIYLHPNNPLKDQRWGTKEEDDILKGELK